LADQTFHIRSREPSGKTRNIFEYTSCMLSATFKKAYRSCTFILHREYSTLNFC